MEAAAFASDELGVRGLSFTKPRRCALLCPLMRVPLCIEGVRGRRRSRRVRGTTSVAGEVVA